MKIVVFLDLIVNSDSNPLSVKQFFNKVFDSDCSKITSTATKIKNYITITTASDIRLISNSALLHHSFESRYLLRST